MEWLSTIADTIGILSAIFALFAWLNTIRIRKEQEQEQARLNEKIKLRLQTESGNAYIELPGEMRREEVTRAEILGWIGMLPMREEEKKKRYEIQYINTAAFLNQINQIQTGQDGTTLVILCTLEELNQFNAEIRTPNNDPVSGKSD
ncbi:MAG: hypothetical protein AB1345_08895 [Chloroflexota bacterium]